MDTTKAMINTASGAQGTAGHYVSFLLPGDRRRWLDRDADDFDVLTYACWREAGMLGRRKRLRRRWALARCARTGEPMARYVYALCTNGLLRPLMVQEPEPVRICNERGQIGALGGVRALEAAAFSLAIDAVLSRATVPGVMALRHHLAALPRDADWRLDAACVRDLSTLEAARSRWAPPVPPDPLACLAAGQRPKPLSEL